MHETKSDALSPAALKQTTSDADQPQGSSDPAPVSGSNEVVDSDTMADTSPVTAEEQPQETPRVDLPRPDAPAAGSEGGIADSPLLSDEVRNVDAALEECRRDGRGLARRLREAERKLERAEAEVADLSAKVTRQRELASKRSAEIQDLRQECDAEKRRAEQEQRRSRVLSKENARLQTVSEALKAKASRLGTANEALQAEIERLGAVTGLQLLTSPLALHWLTRQREKTRLKLPREIVVVGSVPLPKTDMERLLKKAGFLLAGTRGRISRSDGGRTR